MKNRLPTIPEGYQRVISSSVYHYLTNFSSIGLRWHSTRGEKTAQQFIVDAFEKNKLDGLQKEDFRYLGYKPISSKLSLTTPESKNIGCEPLQNTSNDEANGQIVYAGTGTRQEFERMDKRGVDFESKIVMARTATPFWLYSEAEKRHASGVVVITDPPENLVRRCTGKLAHPPIEKDIESYRGSIPGVIISQRDGEEILSILSHGKVDVTLEHRAHYSIQETFNIVGETEGSEYPDEIVVIGAHYDTQLAGGVWDNATGIAGLLEFSRILQGSRPKRTIRYVAFNCEEIGLWGSTNYVHDHANDKLIYNCNLDAVSTSLASVNSVWSTTEIQSYTVELARILGWPVGNTDDLTTQIREFSDMCSFVEAGIPSTWIWETSVTSIHPYYHTEKDLIDFIDPNKLARTLDVNGLLIHSMANSSNLSENH